MQTMISTSHCIAICFCMCFVFEKEGI